MKNLFCFGGFFFKTKIADILNFLCIKYLGKGVNYSWNYGSSKLLLHFSEYSLDQLTNKQTKTAVNSTIQFFESRYQKKHLVKVWSFFDPPTIKWRPCKIFAKLSGNHLLMVNIFKLHIYQTFGLLEMHNTSNIWFANNKFCLWKNLVYN